ncbi:hypothetical protein PQX77_008473 [Marasmius sp. AFHP31]|nr:hypothetical protein PQX77_008473 [Marasmius sp. AFHP31]
MPLLHGKTSGSQSTDLARDSDGEYPLCRARGQETYCTNGVDGVLGTHELGTRARYLETLGGGKGKSTEGDIHRENERNLQVLPPEICDLIISYLSDYPHILRKAMLVCKSWVPLCRRHIYSALNFCCGDNFERVCPYPSLVRRISLVSSYGHASVRWLDPLIQNVQQFSNLDHLEMVDVQWDALWKDDGLGLLNAPVMSQVTTIFLGAVEVEYLDDVATFIGHAFPRLHQLVVSLEVFSDGDEDEDGGSDIHETEVALWDVPTSPPPPPHGWTKFVVQDHPMYPTPTGYWWRWFTTAKFTGLRSITLGGIPKEDYPLLEAYLGIAGHSLLHLGVGFACLEDLGEPIVPPYSDWTNSLHQIYLSDIAFFGLVQVLRA